MEEISIFIKKNQTIGNIYTYMSLADFRNVEKTVCKFEKYA